MLQMLWIKRYVSVWQTDWNISLGSWYIIVGRFNWWDEDRYWETIVYKASCYMRNSIWILRVCVISDVFIVVQCKLWSFFTPVLVMDHAYGETSINHHRFSRYCAKVMALQILNIVTLVSKLVLAYFRLMLQV